MQSLQRDHTILAGFAGTRRPLALPLAIVACLALGVTSALAAKTHRLKENIPINNPVGVALDETSSNVFVANNAFGSGSPPKTIDIFGPEGGTPSGVASPFRIEGLEYHADWEVSRSTTRRPAPPKGGPIFRQSWQSRNEVRPQSDQRKIRTGRRMERLAAAQGRAEHRGRLQWQCLRRRRWRKYQPARDTERRRSHSRVQSHGASACPPHPLNRRAQFYRP